MNTQEQNALKNCRLKFEGLTESERLHQANAFIKFTTSKGGTVNQALDFLSKAEVMTDTELMHAVTF